MAPTLNIMMAGEAGQGIQSVGMLLAKAFARGGYHVFADQDYESRVRGGHNFFRVRIGETDVAAISETIDVLLAFNPDSVQLHAHELAHGGVVIFDGDKAEGIEADVDWFSAPLAHLAADIAGGQGQMANAAGLGAVMGLFRYEQEIIDAVLREHFRDGPTGEANVRVAAAGYDYATKIFKGRFKRNYPVLRNGGMMLLTGNEAIALGAIAAGCTFMSAYPMTPASSIMEYFASKSADLGLVLVQPEDEISAIHMAIGAAYAGTRAMTATSGGGFSLMVEGLGLAGMTETPIVVVLAQRPGPAIGLPTRTEQSDLQCAITASHGEFPRAILAPTSVQDAFWATVKAFNIADAYQLPALILTDQHLASSYSTVPPFDLAGVVIDRGLLVSAQDLGSPDAYRRHQITPSGISPRALPGESRALVITDSDEHSEDGHPIEDAALRTSMMLKRMRKTDSLAKVMAQPTVYGSPKAPTALIGWGSTLGAIKEAVDILQADGMDICSVHFGELWPFPTEVIAEILDRGGSSIVVENNATGQLARLIRAETGRNVSGDILKFDGRPFTPSIIARRVKEEVASWRR